MTTTHFTRYTRMQFEGLLSNESVIIANNDDLGILTLVEHGHILAQETFPRLYRESSVALVKLFWHYYPNMLPYDAVQQWLDVETTVLERDKLTPSTKRLRSSAITIFGYISELRARLKPFGIIIVNKANIGYMLKPAHTFPLRDNERFEDIELPSILDSGYTLTLDHKKRVLTLLQGKALLEQCAFSQVYYSLLQLFLHNDERACSLADIVAFHFNVSEQQAQKWLDQTRGNRLARREFMTLVWSAIATLRKALKPFGISIDNVRDFGYSLGRVRIVKTREKARA